MNVIKIAKCIGLVVLSAAVVMTVFPGKDVSAGSISSMQEQIKENNKKINALKAEINKLKGEKSSVENDIRKLDLEMSTIDAEADGLALEIKELQENIKKNELAITDLNSDIDKSNLLLEQRLRASFKRGDAGYLEIILNSENLIDALTRIDMIQLIVKEDVNLIKDIEKKKSDLENLKNLQEQEKKETEIVKKKLDDKFSELSTAQNAKESYMAALNNDMKKMQAMEAQMEKENRQFEARIQQLLTATEYTGGIMQWPLPLNCTRITSYFGKRPHPLYGYYSNHRGVDIACPYNTNVYAATSGTVIVAEKHWSYGNYVIIDHGGKIATTYAHNTKLLVRVGQKVNKGDVIALSGSTGESTGPHLHFEVRKNGVCVDPLPYVKSN